MNYWILTNIYNWGKYPVRNTILGYLPLTKHHSSHSRLWSLVSVGLWREATDGSGMGFEARLLDASRGISGDSKPSIETSIIHLPSGND